MSNEHTHLDSLRVLLGFKEAMGIAAERPVSPGRVLECARDRDWAGKILLEPRHTR